MKREYYEEEMMVKEAITSQKSDKEIGMPDIESELKRVKQSARRKHPMLSGWQRIAAVFAVAVTISGLVWAVVYYNQHQPATTHAEQQQMKTTTTTTERLAEEVPEDTIVQRLTLSYDKSSLKQIVMDLTAHYHLEQPVFENQKAALKYKLHITFNQEGSIQDAVDLLNQFGNIHIELVDNKLIVK